MTGSKKKFALSTYGWTTLTGNQTNAIGMMSRGDCMVVGGQCAAPSAFRDDSESKAKFTPLLAAHRT